MFNFFDDFSQLASFVGRRKSIFARKLIISGQAFAHSALSCQITLSKKEEKRRTLRFRLNLNGLHLRENEDAN